LKLNVIIYSVCILFGILFSTLASKLLYHPNIALPTLTPTHPLAVRSLPDFNKISDFNTRRTVFFKFLAAFIKHENKIILKYRKTVLALKDKQEWGKPLTNKEIKWLKGLAKRYRIKALYRTPIYWKLMRKRIDIIPVSLALAQAAIESAWGTSRFAKQANNLFGQWCFTKGCGLVPAQRPANAKFEVQKFTSIHQSIQSYMLNLNTNPAYKTLRNIRVRMRNEGEPLRGIPLAIGLLKYSARGEGYVNTVKKVIWNNHLYHYN
jgi:Bax protein